MYWEIKQPNCVLKKFGMLATVKVSPEKRGVTEGTCMTTSLVSILLSPHVHMLANICTVSF